MASSFKSEAGRRAFEACVTDLRECCGLIEEFRFAEALAPLARARSTQLAASSAESDDLALRELYALEQFVAFFEKYAYFWRLVYEGAFDATWNALQDSLDALRSVKRFSDIDISFFENQLVGLEETFPYRIFASVGAVSDFTECSICGQDMESFDCSHRRGELYGGRLAIGTVRSLRLEHVSLVTNPVDKRCIIWTAGTKYDFPALKFIRDALHADQLRIGWVELFEWTERPVPRVSQPRNAECSCGSGKKYKRCCLQRPPETYRHVELLPRVNELAAAVG